MSNKTIKHSPLPRAKNTLGVFFPSSIDFWLKGDFTISVINPIFSISVLKRDHDFFFIICKKISLTMREVVVLKPKICQMGFFLRQMRYVIIIKAHEKSHFWRYYQISEKANIQPFKVTKTNYNRGYFVKKKTVLDRIRIKNSQYA